jgi:hypothetical protein
VRLGFCAAVVVLLRAGDANADLQCSTPEQREATLRDLRIGAGIRYGDSTDEIALYRLVRGIDNVLLRTETRDLSFGDAWIPEVNTPGEQQAQFEVLLKPESQLIDPVDVNGFQAAELFLQDQGLRSYRPEYGLGDYPADWWLDGARNRVYQTLDVAEWLQTMAASDTYHRVSRVYGRRGYRSMRSSWTYFDPWQWDKHGYVRVTDRALDRWRKNGDPLWLAAGFSRVTWQDGAAAELLGTFSRLHAKVKLCTATRNETLIYPLLRFHALRLMFQDGVQNQDSLQRALDLLRDPLLPAPVFNETTSDFAAADRAARLLSAELAANPGLAGWMDSVASTEAAPITSSSAPGTYVDAFRNLGWAYASNYVQYLQSSKGRWPSLEDQLILNGLSVKALWELAQSKAFTPEFRLDAARSAWLRATLLGRTGLADEILTAVAAEVPAFADMGPQILAAHGPEKQRLTLLMLLRHPEIGIELPRVAQSTRWCGKLNPTGYQATVNDLFGPVLRLDTIPISEQWAAINYREGLFERHNSSPDYAVRQSERWWWSGRSFMRSDPNWLRYYGPSGPEPSPFDRDELRRLAELPPAPVYLAERAIAWAKESESGVGAVRAWFGLKVDQRPAEALHFAVLAAKRGCNGDEGRSSRAAWIVLHRNKLWKEWADKTPYWYD